MQADDAMVIVGAGHVGGRAAHALRDAGWKGPIAIVGAEPHVPYERPPLSKDLLTGAKTGADCALYAPEAYAERSIDLRTGIAVMEIKRDRHEVVLADGSTLAYHRLLLATGAEPRRLDLPGIGLDGVHYLRTLDDASALDRRIAGSRRIVIIGGGFIGLEVASNLSSRGCLATIVEAGPRLLTRAVPSPIEAEIRALHQANGVDIRLSQQVAAILGEGHVAGVRLADGDVIACDAVLVSVGVLPRVDLARDAGLAVDNGIAVDRTLRTEDRRIFAAGDACAFLHRLYGRRIRLESWKNAEEQAPLAARNMMGAAEECCAVPWMWSDQYNVAIQIAGMPELSTCSVERRIEPDALIVFHLADDGRIVGTSAIGPTGRIGRIVRLGQMMIERSLYPEPALLADPSVDLKPLVRERAA